MNTRTLSLLAAAALVATTLAALDFGGLSKGLDSLKQGVDKTKQTVDKGKELADDANKLSKVGGIGPKEERQIGDATAVEIVSRFGGLVRDEEITRRVNVIGLALARSSDRPEIEWRFGVLESDTANAFSAPGGWVFITRGLYETAANDDVLAGILAHEIAHVARKHALKIVGRGEAGSVAKKYLLQRSATARDAAALGQQLNSTVGYNVTGMWGTLLKNGFDAPTEYDADKVGRGLAVTSGFAPGGLRAALAGLQAHGENRQTTFSTHPPLAERLKRLPDDPAPATAP